MELETKEIMKQWMEVIRRRGKEYEPQEIKLRRINSKKYCINCKELVKIKTRGKAGYCPNENCKCILYTIDARIKNREKK